MYTFLPTTPHHTTSRSRSADRIQICATQLACPHWNADTDRTAPAFHKTSCIAVLAFRTGRGSKPSDSVYGFRLLDGWMDGRPAGASWSLSVVGENLQ
ncbi:hypothetical protein HBI70_036010 [Parastagonospora nodorum]|nr:hypothetical protein HBH42_047140 [Parastagonospora nodorum]KAH5059497.1 hypothetical protein HBH96_087200 [Parastagonospora nodorum]KAH5285554.1 hypothetical protein HBI70_036010 [Parastagonospora nodorum]KAH5490180.1 hypothetical protein HBI31_131700 [Parastagonospora nodorum]KAH5514004.1 hypothetical protein HBI52_115470 [Parastagonospora nodorum]